VRIVHVAATEIVVVEDAEAAPPTQLTTNTEAHVTDQQEPTVTLIAATENGGTRIELGRPRVGWVTARPDEGRHRATMARWLRGDTEPRLPQLLAFVDGLTHRLVEFVALFVAPESVPCVRELSRALDAQRRIAYELPWSHAVLRALELDGYRALPAHVPGFIGQSIGIGAEQEERLLEALRVARLIRRQRAKWTPTRVLTVDTRADPKRDQQLKEHWAEVGLDRLRRRRNEKTDALHSFNLFAVSHADFGRLRELHLEYYERVRRIVAESNRADRVVLLNQQLVPLDETRD